MKILSILLPICLILGYLLVTGWPMAGLHPSLWADTAVAAGLRPPERLVPGFFILLLRGVRVLTGSDETGVALFTGRLFRLLLIFHVYLTFHLVLTKAVRSLQAPCVRAVLSLSAVLGSVAFILSNPVWVAGNALSPSLIHLVLAFGAAASFLLTVQTGKTMAAAYSAICFGLLSADTPFGLLLLGLFLASSVIFERRKPPTADRYERILHLETRKWPVTFLFLSAYAGALFANGWAYVHLGGLTANNQSLASLPLLYLFDCWHILTSATTLPAALILVVLCLLPTLVTLRLFSRATDEDRFLPYGVGLVFLFCGLLSLVQCAGFGDFWIWRHVSVSSPFLLTLGLAGAALTLSLAVAVLCYDLFCRDYRTIASRLIGDNEALATPRWHTVLSPRARIVTVSALAVLITLLMIRARTQPTTRQMQQIVSNAILAIVREAKGLDRLITDGRLDEAIELASNGKIVCVPLVDDKKTARNTFLRLRCLTNDTESAFTFSQDVGLGLRTWILSHPDRLSTVGLMMGLDLWKREGKPLPAVGGLLARPCGYPTEQMKRQAIDNADHLADATLNVYARPGGIHSCTDEAIRESFLAVQWRLAQMAEHRSEAEELLGHVRKATTAANRARCLNDLNPIYGEISTAVKKSRAAAVRLPTPKERLLMNLEKADFETAKSYAEIVLTEDPDEPNALFALAMYFLRHHRLHQAKQCLMHCLVRKPNEPAVYNNLAMIEIELGLLDEAEGHVNKTLELIPDSAAALDTRKRLRAAREGALSKKEPTQ